MKKIVITALTLILVNLMLAQNIKTVEVIGVGFGSTDKEKRDNAIEDAYRLAVGQASGVALESMTEVKNFITLKDAICTRTKGYIKSFKIIKEASLGEKYEVTMSADVSLEPIKADAKILSEMIGGVNFIVIYDARNFSPAENEIYQYTYERINEKLGEKGYERTEAALYNEFIEELNKESENSFLQKIGLHSKREFIIQIKKITIKSEIKARGLIASKAIMEIKTYDNCNWRAIGTSEIQGDWEINADQDRSVKAAIANTINTQIDRLLSQFTRDIGTWVEKGAPYELRFYSFDVDDNDMLSFAGKIAEDVNTVGDPLFEAVDEYFKLEIRSKSTQFKVMTLVNNSFNAVENFKRRFPTREMIYGRQLVYTPKGIKNPEVEEMKSILK
ncbi:MAG: hypothetical protein U0W24_21970 [Bacteroidales bacterium]